MPKSQFIDPAKARAKGKITFGEIPVNAYDTPFSTEAARHSKEDMLRIYHDMQLIREFETMLNLIKTTGEYQGISYNHPGPAHLSIGQEASAVGMAHALEVDDHIFGSFRK